MPDDLESVPIPIKSRLYMSKGFIPIRRSLFKHFLFNERRAFSRFEAWLDLIQLASFLDGQTDLIKGKVITRNRGEIVASIRWLASRWNWSNHKTSDFLELLRSQEMVVVANENGITKLSLVNFEKNNSIGFDEGDSNGDRQTNGIKRVMRKTGTATGTDTKDDADSKRDSKRDTQNGEGQINLQDQGTVKGTQKGTVAGQSRDSQGTNYNKDNELKNSNGENAGAGAPSPPGNVLNKKQEDMLKRKEGFYKQLAVFVPIYGKAMVRAFFNHWSEPNKSKTQMNFELERTWDLSGRLATWEKRELLWNKGKTQGTPVQKAPAGLTKSQEEINYLYARYLEGQITVISVDWLHFNDLAKSEMIIFSADEIDQLKKAAKEYMQGQSIEITDDLAVKYAKRFGVLEFFKRWSGQGKETVFAST